MGHMPDESVAQPLELADDFNAQFIIDGVTQARAAFERRITTLHPPDR